jgi:hypothetical protein
MYPSLFRAISVYVPAYHPRSRLIDTGLVLVFFAVDSHLTSLSSTLPISSAIVMRWMSLSHKMVTEQNGKKGEEAPAQQTYADNCYGEIPSTRSISGSTLIQLKEVYRMQSWVLRLGKSFAGSSSFVLPD